MPTRKLISFDWAMKKLLRSKANFEILEGFLSELLKKDVELYPDAYQHERAERLGCSQRGISDALKRLRISRKKTLSHPKADEKARCIFIDRIMGYRQADIDRIYIDESGFSFDIPRIRSYAPVGERCRGEHDRRGPGDVYIDSPQKVIAL